MIRSALLPTISLVTCSFQQGRFLDATIRSVLDQSYPGLEYLVVDGGSTDGSTEVIQRHARHLAYWVSEADGGQTDALAKGFERATGELQGWLCSDDLLLPGALESVAQFFQDHPQAEVVFGDALWIDAEGRFIRAKKEMPFNRFVFLYDHNYVPQPSMFWRRSLYQRVGGLDRAFHLAMDTNLWDRFSRVAQIHHIPCYLSCMRYYPEQKTRRLHDRSRKEDELIRSRNLTHSIAGKLPYPLARLAARLVRVAVKSVSGGYGAQVPAECLAHLPNYAPPADR